MAGHSQFKNIMHRKGAQDAKRAKIFTKFSREISVAVKEGGSNPEFNPRLRSVLIAARGVNMPKDNIDKAIKKADGQEHDNFESIVYEGYGPYGVAIVIEALTNNRNRTSSDIKAAFNKYNGSLGTPGSVSFLFDHRGIIKINNTGKITFDKLFEIAVEHGAEDVFDEQEAFIVITAISDLYKIVSFLSEELKVDIEISEFTWMPKVTVELSEEQRQTINKLVNALEESDDVQRVFFNA